MRQIPILFLGDNPTEPTGLGRIGRDLARQLVERCSDIYRVGYMGRGIRSSRRLPFAQYPFHPSMQWGEQLLPYAWNDFAGDEPGIVFSIWDATRLDWLALPQNLPPGELRDFLMPRPFKLWGYFPIDSVGPLGKQSALPSAVLRAYDEVLAYLPFGADQILKSTGRKVEWIPHGYNPKTFRPHDKQGSRNLMLMPSDKRKVLGCVMSNQARKDWGLAFEVLHLLGEGWVGWFHVDVLDRYWSFPALIEDFQVADRVFVTTNMSSEELSHFYSACDVTILPSGGEGFGYPIVESMACGVPCATGAYSGCVDLPCGVPSVAPSVLRVDTRHNCRRAQYTVEDWIDHIGQATSKLYVSEDGRAGREATQEEKRDLLVSKVEHLQWPNLWPRVWEKWWRRMANKFWEGVQ